MTEQEFLDELTHVEGFFLTRDYYIRQNETAYCPIEAVAAAHDCYEPSFVNSAKNLGLNEYFALLVAHAADASYPVFNYKGLTATDIRIKLEEICLDRRTILQ